MTAMEIESVDVKVRLARMEAQMATKEDVERMGATLVKWMIGLMFGFTSSMIVVMTFVLNYAAPPQGRFAKAEVSAPVQPAPIIITVPPGALQWQPAPEGAQPSPRKP